MTRNPKARPQSGKTGVRWHVGRGKWTAHIRIDGERECLGYFDSELDAITARTVAERQVAEWINYRRRKMTRRDKAKFYASRDWRELRMIILERDRATC